MNGIIQIIIKLLIGTGEENFMDKMPIYMVLLQSFPETLILIYIGLALTGAALSHKKIMIIALAGACVSYFIRGFPIPPGSNVFIQLPVVVILLFLLGELPLWLSLVSIILGFLCVSFAEMMFIPLVAAISGISVQAALANPL